MDVYLSPAQLELRARVRAFLDESYPPERILPAAIDTYDDHRMAMSFALAGLRDHGVVINDPQCCAKTFPDYFDRFEAATQAST